MFIDYKSQVVHDYQAKRDAGALSLRLIRPTPGQLKDECMAVCNDRYHRKDEMTLKAFFGQAGDKVTCLQAIKRCGIDKFRPLVNFLRQSTGATEDKNIELLAWLIDFEPRPFALGRKYESIPGIEQGELPKNLMAEKVQEEESGQSEEGAVSVQTASGKPVPVLKTRRVAITAIILALLIIGIYLGWPGKSPTLISTGPQGCMYWAEDHYQQVSCNQKIGDTLVIALDSEKLVHFRKITRPDTITEYSIGKIWCVKFNGNYEYYTAQGFHPIDQRLRLRPLSHYIFSNHHQ